MHIAHSNQQSIGIEPSGIEQHEMLHPFISQELRDNMTNLITPKIRDLVEIYQVTMFTASLFVPPLQLGSCFPVPQSIQTGSRPLKSYQDSPRARCAI